MNIDPTPTRRTVILNIRTAHTSQPDPTGKANTSGETVTCIDILIDDGAQVTEARFSGAAEVELLRAFWEAVQVGDVFYGYNVVDRLALLRRRAWALRLIPSHELDLRKVYRHETCDTAGYQSSTGDAGYRSAQALATVLELATET